MISASIRRLVKPLWAGGKNLASSFGNADAMFKLGRKAPVAGHRRPAILQHFARCLADVDHRFDRENHAGAQFGAGSGTSDMDDFGGVVKKLAEAMAAKVADYAVAMLFRMSLYRMADIAHMIAGLGLFNAEHQAFVSDIDQALCLDRNIADQKHAAGVAMPSVQHWRNIDIDDVAIFQPLIGWDTMADDMVDAGAAAMRITAIAERCGYSTGAQGHLADNVVQFFGRHTRHDVRYQCIEDFGSEATGLSHAFKALGSMQFDDPVAGQTGLGGRYFYIMIHVVDIERYSPLCERGIYAIAVA